MKQTRIVLALIILSGVQFSCYPGTVTPFPPATSTSIQPIGSVEKIQGAVEAGPESDMASVDPKRDIHDNDAIHVFDSGKASLDLGYGLVFTLYNDTMTGGTSVDMKGTSPQALLKLSQGGLKGFNPPGSRTEVDLPTGGKILILGTDYFIAYDSSRNIVWIYNYDGALQYSFGGSDFKDLPRRALLDYNDGVISVNYDREFSTDDFDSYATGFNSPLQGLEELFKEYPLPTVCKAPDSFSQITKPEEFVRCYFTVIWRDQNYKYLWTLLTENFKKGTVPGGYSEYVQWANGIVGVNIQDVIVLSLNEDLARVQVKLTFYMKDGNVIPNEIYDYYLIYNYEQQTWQFDVADERPPSVSNISPSATKVYFDAGDCSLTVTTLTVTASVSDSTGVDKVTLSYWYSKNGGDSYVLSKSMTYVGENTYQAVIDLSDEAGSYGSYAGGTLSFSVQAGDKAGNKGSPTHGGSVPVGYYCIE